MQASHAALEVCMYLSTGKSAPAVKWLEGMYVYVCQNACLFKTCTAVSQIALTTYMTHVRAVIYAATRLMV